MRARETAGILAAGFGLEPQTADGLREPDCGIAEGRSDAEAWDLHAEQEAAWKAGVLDHKIPGGESFLEVRDRFVPFVEGLLIRHNAEAGSVLLVSHGSVLVNMLPLVLANVSVEFPRAGIRWRTAIPSKRRLSRRGCGARCGMGNVCDDTS